jgi:hypothetical protein
MLPHFTVAPERTLPVAMFVIFPVSVPVDEACVREKLVVLVPPAVRVTLCVAV